MIGSLAPPLTAEQNSAWGGDQKKTPGRLSGPRAETQTRHIIL